jgi:CheY-like chemotaxis protein
MSNLNKFHRVGPSTSLSGPRSETPSGKPTILVVNGDHYVSAIIWTLLNKFDFDVVSETSGPAGLQLARGLAPDAVVLDVNLPDLNGLEICRRLKADLATRALPVVFCSTQRYLADEAVELGAAAFLDGISGVIQLPACLGNLLSARRAASSKT